MCTESQYVTQCTHAWDVREREKPTKHSRHIHNWVYVLQHNISARMQSALLPPLGCEAVAIEHTIYRGLFVHMHLHMLIPAITCPGHGGERNLLFDSAVTLTSADG